MCSVLCSQRRISVDLVNLIKTFPTSILLKTSASIEPRTSPPQFPFGCCEYLLVHRSCIRYLYHRDHQDRINRSFYSFSCIMFLKKYFLFSLQTLFRIYGLINTRSHNFHFLFNTESSNIGKRSFNLKRSR